MDECKYLSYKEFKSWCNERACDGQWDLHTSIICSNIIKSIDNHYIKILGIKLKNKTERLQEALWEECKQSLFELNK